jgi:hypothetical protein
LKYGRKAVQLDIYIAKNYKTGRDHLLAGLKAFVKAGESEADTSKT